MKRFMYAVLSLMLTAALVLSAVPVAFAAQTSGDYTYEELEDGTAKIIKYTGMERNLIVPSELDGHTVTAVGNEAFSNNRFIKYVELPDTITSMGTYVFVQCGELRTVKLPKYLTEVPMGVCYYSPFVYGITFPENVTTIGESAFGYTAFHSLDFLPDTITTIEDFAFSHGQLFSAVVPDTVTTLGRNVFNQCYTLKTVEIGSGVTVIPEELFYWCTDLEEVTLSDSVTAIGKNAFENTPDLKTIYYDGFEGDWYNVAIDSTNDDELANVNIVFARPLGDLNGDGTVNTIDALRLYIAAAGRAELTEDEWIAADYDGNGTVNMRDVLAVFRTACGY